MSDNPQAADTQAEEAAQPQAGTTDDKTQAVESISLEEAKKLRSEAANLRKRLKSFEESEEQRKQAEMSEAEKLTVRQKQLEAREHELTAKERRLAVRDGLTEAATAAKLRLNRDVTTDDLLRYLPLDELEWDDAAGTVKNLTPLLTSLAKSKPFLFDGRKRDGSADGGETSTADKPTFKTPVERLSSAYANKR